MGFHLGQWSAGDKGRVGDENTLHYEGGKSLQNDHGITMSAMGLSGRQN